MLNEFEVYEKIYDIAEKNMERAGQKMIFTKDAFLFSTKRDLQYIDMLEVVDFDRAAFLECLYVGFFSRTPEETARNSWAELQNVSLQEYQKRVFQSLVSSQEFLKNGTIVCNNVYSLPTVRMGATAVQTVNSNPYVEKLLKIYRKIPAPLRTIIKKMLGK